MLLFLVVGLVLVLLISRAVRYATTISPLEASRRVAVSESGRARARLAYSRMARPYCSGPIRSAVGFSTFNSSSYLTFHEDDSA